MQSSKYFSNNTVGIPSMHLETPWEFLRQLHGHKHKPNPLNLSTTKDSPVQYSIFKFFFFFFWFQQSFRKQHFTHQLHTPPFTTTPGLPLLFRYSACTIKKENVRALPYNTPNHSCKFLNYHSPHCMQEFQLVGPPPFLQHQAPLLKTSKSYLTVCRSNGATLMLGKERKEKEDLHLLSLKKKKNTNTWWKSALLSICIYA